MNTQRFSKVTSFFVLLSFVMVACTSTKNTVFTNTVTPSITSLPTITTTSTTIPSLTPTITPTIALPVGIMTSAPSSNTQIAQENVNGLQEVARYYGKIDYSAKITKDKRFLFVQDNGGLNKYDYQTLTLLNHVTVAGTSLQISDNGEWALVGNWLVDFRSEQSPIVHDLLNEIHFQQILSGNTITFALSPLGTLLAVSECRCSGGTGGVRKEGFQILNLQDNSVVYAWDGKDTQRLHGIQPTFSPSGTYLATQNEMWGHSVDIWNISDFSKTSSITIQFPYTVTYGGIAFSNNEKIIAIGQENFIGIYDFINKETITSITGLCQSYVSQMIFFPISPLTFFEDRNCYRENRSEKRIWTVNSKEATFTQANNNLNFNRISFDDNGNPETIPYPNRFLGNWSSPTNIKFPYTNVLAFEQVNKSNGSMTPCYLQIYEGMALCKNQVIMGTDGQYYSYSVDNSNLVIRPLADENKIIFTTPWKTAFSPVLKGLDPINNLVFYNEYQTSLYAKAIIRDMGSNLIVADWDNSQLTTTTFSKDKNLVAACVHHGNTWGGNDGTLFLLDLTQKNITYQTRLSCYTAIDLSNDGSKLAANYYSNETKTNKIFVMDTSAPFQRVDFQIADLENGIKFSPKDKMLAVRCANSLCFINSLDGGEISRIKIPYPDLNSWAFSPDGTMLATSARSISSDWAVISLWAIPPFTFEQTRSEPSNFPVFPLSFIYPLDGQTINYNEDYNFKVTPRNGASGYLWSFSQNGVMIWENYRDEGILSDNEYSIIKNSPAHSKFVPGILEISVRAYVNDNWTDATIITVNLSEDAPTSTPLLTDTPTSTPTKPPTTTPIPTIDVSRAAFFTGWENGQPEGFGNLVLDSKNVSGANNSSDPPPEASPRSLESWATPKMAPNGGSAYLMVAGYSQKPDSYIYFKLFDRNIKIEKGMKLRYWIYTFQGTTFAIDGQFSDGTTIRDLNNNGFLTDQNGNRIHPEFQGVYDTGTWRYVEVDLSNAAGKVLKTLMVDFINSDGMVGSIRAYIDNLSISP